MNTTILIKEVNGKDETFYHEDYVSKLLDHAFRAGIAKGIRIEFHALDPQNEEEVTKLIELFNSKVEEIYKYEKCK